MHRGVLHSLFEKRTLHEKRLLVFELRSSYHELPREQYAGYTHRYSYLI